MIRDDSEQADVPDRDGSMDRPGALEATIEDVFDRLMALDGAMSTLAEAEVGMAQALQRAETVAGAYCDRPEHAKALRRLDELRDVAYTTLDVLVRECPIAIGAAEGPPARGSSPHLAAPARARRDTLADCPHALRGAPSDTGTAAPDGGLASGAPSPLLTLEPDV